MSFHGFPLSLNAFPHVGKISEAECILAFRPEGTLFQAYQAAWSSAFYMGNIERPCSLTKLSIKIQMELILPLALF